MEKIETVLITGGTGLIGQEMVKAFAAKGYRPLFTSRSQEKIDALEKIVPESQGLLCDFSEGVRAVDTLLPQLKTVHHVIHGYRDTKNLATGADALPNEDQWIREYQAAVVIPYALTMALADKGLKTATLISSIYGVSAANLNLYDGDQSKAPVHYNVAKAAQNHAAKELAVRLAPKNIRVNAIAYGGVKGRASPDFEKKYASLTPYKGMLESAKVATSAVFLASDDAEHITGHILNVDGGWSVW